MSIDRFAKLFDTPTTQVLCVMQYESEDGMCKLVVWCSDDGVRCEVGYGFVGDSREGDMEREFEAFDQAKADRFAANFRALHESGVAS